MFKLPAIVKIGSIIVLFMVVGAHPHDLAAMKDPQRDAWYKSLENSDKTRCCDLTDAAHIEQRFVRQLADKSWEVFLTDAGRWFKVPANRIVTNKPSIDGEPYLFRFDGLCLICGQPPSPIRCFVPPIPGF
jgi:hypothetical protein